MFYINSIYMFVCIDIFVCVYMYVLLCIDTIYHNVYTIHITEFPFPQ